MRVFLVKVVNRSYNIINVMRICKMLISCIKLDHALYLISYDNNNIISSTSNAEHYQRLTCVAG